jgi:hypothetical protein
MAEITIGMPAPEAVNSPATKEDRPGEHGLEMLVRRVLRSTLEQARTRQLNETGR